MFLNIKTDDGHVAPFEQFPCGNITPKAGMLMALSSGKLALAAGTTVPEFLCVEEHASSVSDGTPVTVVRIDHDTIYETTLSTSGTLTVGVKYTIAADGLRVTATSTTGVAECMYVAGTASGDIVHVRF